MRPPILFALVLVPLAAEAAAQSFIARGPLPSLPPNVQYFYGKFYRGNFHGDGRDELLGHLSGFASSGLDYLSSDGTDWSIVTIPELFAAAPEPIVADFDSDGYDDYAAVNVIGDKRLRIRFGGPGSPPGLAVVQSPSPFPGSYQSLGLDYDGDGDTDLITMTSSEFAIFRNEGARNLTPVTLSAAAPVLGLPAYTAMDLDGDGRDDLVVSYLSSASAGALGWMRSLGNSQFAAIQPLLPGGTPRASRLSVADVDGDGDDDLLMEVLFTGGSSRTSAWVEIAPGPQATFHQNHLSSPSAPEVIGDAIDVDLDGTLDLLTLDSSSSSILYTRGLGGGLFAAPVPIQTTMGARAATAIDVDGDGDFDLLSSELEWFENVTVISTRTCPGEPNSVGPGATLFGVGTASASLNRMTLNAVGLPPGAFGMFLTSLLPATPIQVPNSQGLLCLGGSIARFNRAGEIRTANPAGILRLQLDTSDIPDAIQTTIPILPPETRYFQLWYRDASAGISTSNFTGAARIEFR